MKQLTIGGLLLLGAMLAPTPAHAQVAAGAIAGTVRDTTAAVLPGVTVEATSPALIEGTRAVTTDAQGNYKIVDLRPGLYTVTFTLPGFSTFKREGIELTTGFTANANAEMKVGALEETVTVSGASPVVDVQNTRAQNVLKQEVLEALPAGRTNAGFAELTLGAASMTGGAAVVDQGGSKGDSSQRLTVHGMRAFDQRIYTDGMLSNQMLSSGKQWQTNQMGIQEVVMGTSSGSSEVETSGMQINFIPKEGGNSYRMTFNGAGSNNSLQANNISDEIRATGVTTGQEVKSVYDWGFGLGGPLKKNTLWFYTAERIWAAQEYQPGAFFNKSTSPYTYVADTDRRAFADLNAKDASVRLTWQATAKQKLNLQYMIQSSCQCYLLLNSQLSPDAAPSVRFSPAQHAIATWTYAKSNKLLIDAGYSFPYFVHNNTYETTFPDAIRITEASTGVSFGNGSNSIATAEGYSHQFPTTHRVSLSYVSGAHAFKVGEQWIEGFSTGRYTIPSGLTYTFLNGRPQSLTQWALPVAYKSRMRNIGLFAQDQWTMNRLTLNLGVRFDRYVGWVPSDTREAGRFTPAFGYDEVKNVPNLNDINPRLGAAYDVFGNGKTAVKGAFGRYVGALGVEFQEGNNPALSVVQSVTRTWNDVNGNFVPDCDLTSLDANSIGGDACGLANNRLFGQVARNTFYDPSVTEGWGQRAYGWQGNLTLQQELGPGLAANVTYFYQAYSNFSVTQNELVSAGSFDPYCVAAPADARLPGGGGNQICGLFDVNPSRFGQVRNLVTAAGAVGKQTERFDGVDVLLSARLPRAGVLQGGVSLGRQQYDNCYVNSRPDVTTTNLTTYAPPAAAVQSRTEDFCHIVPPWSAGTQYKANGFFPLPWWGLEPSFTFQNLPGAQILANRATPNAQIAPSLGRNLSAGANATVNIALIPAQTMFLDRVTTINLGLAKTVKIGGFRVKGRADVYNILNDSTVLNANNTYGPTWQRPTSIIGGRLLRLGAQVDF